MKKKTIWSLVLTLALAVSAIGATAVAFAATPDTAEPAAAIATENEDAIWEQIEAVEAKSDAVFQCGADAPHPDFFAHDAGKLLLQIGAAGAAYLRENGFEPEMVCGPNVLAMTSPCDAEDALDRLAEVLAAWDKNAAPPAAAPHILPAPGAVRCTIGAALLRPSRIVPMQSAVGQTAAEYLWAYPPGVPLIAPGEEVTAALAAACEELEKAGTRIKHIGGSGPDKISVI